MTFKSDYWDIVNAVVAKVKEITSLENRVTVGEQTKIYQFPLAFVVPIRDPIEFISTGYIRHRVGIRVVLMTQGTDPETCLKEAIDLGCDTYDKLMSDIKLGGKSDWLAPALFEPDYSIGDTKTLSWVILEFQAYKDRLEVT